MIKKKWLYFALIAVFLFFGSFISAKATNVIISQNLINTDLLSNSCESGGFVCATFIANNSGIPTSVDVDFWAFTGGSPVSMQIREGTDVNGSIIMQSDNSVSGGFTTGNHNYRTFTFTSTSTLQKDNYYTLRLIPNAGGGQTYFMWGKDGNNNPPHLPNGLFYYILNGNEVIENAISILTPSNNVTTTDFSSWVIQFTDLNPLYSNDRIKLSYSITTSTLNLFDIPDIDVSGSPPDTFLSFEKTNVLTTGLWYTQAYLVSSSSQVFATSSLISFTIGFPTSTYIMPPTSTSTDLIISCDPNSNFFTNSLCNVLTFLFVPSQTQYNYFLTAYQTKAPFGYFYIVKNALNNLQNTTTTLQFAGVASLGVIFTPINTSLSFVLWILFIFWLYHTIKRIDL